MIAPENSQREKREGERGRERERERRESESTRDKEREKERERESERPRERERERKRERFCRVVVCCLFCVKFDYIHGRRDDIVAYVAYPYRRWEIEFRDRHPFAGTFVAKYIPA